MEKSKEGYGMPEWEKIARIMANLSYCGICFSVLQYLQLNERKGAGNEKTVDKRGSKCLVSEAGMAERLQFYRK